MAGQANSFGPGTRAVYVVRNYGSPNIPPISVVFDPLALPEQFGAGSLVVFPNPVRENEVLQIRSPLTAPVTVTISDVTGTIVTRSILEVQENSITLPDLAAGMYLLELSNSSGLVKGGRLVIE